MMDGYAACFGFESNWLYLLNEFPIFLFGTDAKIKMADDVDLAFLYVALRVVPNTYKFVRIEYVLQIMTDNNAVPMKAGTTPLPFAN